MHKTEQFNYLGYLGCPLDQLVQDPAGILKAVFGECASRFLQTTSGLTASPVPEGTA